MVEMVGRKSHFGVSQFLRQVKGETLFADLLQEYDPKLEATPPDPAAKQLDALFQAAKRALADASPRLIVTQADESDLFDVTLKCARPPVWPPGKLNVSAWPITQSAERSQSLGDCVAFTRLSYEGLTPLIAFSIKAEVPGAKSETAFVMNLPLEGAPADRQDRLLASLLAGRDQLLRYILFLLSARDEAAVSSSDLARLISETDAPSDGSLPPPCLLETMVRALHRGPAQLERVASLLNALRKSPNGSELLSPEFASIWEPIWQTAQHYSEK